MCQYDVGPISSRESSREPQRGICVLREIGKHSNLLDLRPSMRNRLLSCGHKGLLSNTIALLSMIKLLLEVISITPMSI